jgi:hypothetical protein
VSIDPYNNVALKVTEQNNDDVLLISADETGAAIEVRASDAAKGLIGTVSIKPSDHILQSKDSDGNVLVEMTMGDGDPNLTLYEVAKDGKASFPKVKIDKDSMCYFDATGDPYMRLYSSGNILTRGQIATGQNFSSKDGTRELAEWSTVFGYNNSAPGDSAGCLSGFFNSADGSASVVCGGSRDSTYRNGSVVAGGNRNIVEGRYSFIGSGQRNRIGDVQWSVISGGRDNGINSNSSAVGGGWGNYVANAPYCAIPGGFQDTVFGRCSMAFGENVTTYQERNVTFFDGDSSGSLGINRDHYDGQTDHPIHVGTNTSNGNGAYLSAGGTWTDGSSRTFKDRFEDLDGEELLAKVASLPVQSWYYKNSDERHIGPVAEDFADAFAVGAIGGDGELDNKYLSPKDVSGVALAAVKELQKRNDALEARVAELQALIEKLLSERQ